MSRNLLWFNLQAIKTAKWDYWSQRHLLFSFAEAPVYIATKTLLLFKKKTAQSFHCSNSDDTVRHVHARCRFLEVLQLKHEISSIIASCVIMAFCSSDWSLVGGTCGPSPENPNVVHFFDSKNCDRDIGKAHSRFCNIFRRMLKASIAKE